MNFTEEELAAILKVAKKVALADQVFKKEEKDLIIAELGCFNINPGVQLQIIESYADGMTQENAFSILRDLSPEQKKYVLGFLVTIGKIDNNLDSKEALVIEAIAILINYPVAIKDFMDLSGFYLSSKDLKFNSKNHKRFEHGVLVSDDYVTRIITINFHESGRKMSVSIDPTLSLKYANLSECSNNIITYIGEDPDYKFVIELEGEEKNIVRFSVFRLDRDLEIRYL
jgi:uncharacterized tellurite resistance protein B-like protein